MKRILALDGGGMKGLVSCSVLAEFERLTGKPCYQQFDLVAGTSVGAIVACLLVKGVAAKDALDFFTEDGPQIFNRRFWSLWGLAGPKYGADVIEERLQARFGTWKVGDALTKLLVTSLDIKSGDGYFFKSYGEDSSAEDFMWQAARASSAAQTFFPAYALDNLLLFDGGNVANNPSACALADAVALWGAGEHFRVLSLGCGMDAEPVAGDSIANAGLLRVGVKTISMLFEADSSETDYLMSKVLADDYVRYQPRLAQYLPMDDASPDGLARLQAAAKAAIAGFAPALAQFQRV